MNSKSKNVSVSRETQKSQLWLLQGWQRLWSHHWGLPCLLQHMLGWVGGLYRLPHKWLSGENMFQHPRHTAGIRWQLHMLQNLFCSPCGRSRTLSHGPKSVHINGVMVVTATLRPSLSLSKMLTLLATGDSYTMLVFARFVIKLFICIFCQNL